MDPAYLSKSGTGQSGRLAGWLKRSRVKRVDHTGNIKCTYAALQVHMCSMNGSPAECYSICMKPEQKIIARWIQRVAAKKGWSYLTWANAAKLGAATTITRALKEDYQSVTSVTTLHALARSAGEPSVLDFLEGKAFSAAALRPVLSELLQLAPKRGWTAQDVEHLAEALEYGLGLPPSDHATPASADAYATAARAAVDRFRDLDAQS